MGTDHYCDVILGVMASQITSRTIVYSIAHSGADRRKHQSSASLAFVRGIHRRPVNSPYKGSVTRKMCPFDDVIMLFSVVAMNTWTTAFTEALKGHRVVWKIEIYYLIRMTYEWKSMSSGWHNNIVVTRPDEIPISAKSSGWHMVVWYVIRMTYCSVQKSSGWDTARS